MSSKTNYGFCNICLIQGKLYAYNKLNLCTQCFEKVKSMEKEERIKISKEQTAGGLKDEL